MGLKHNQSNIAIIPNRSRLHWKAQDEALTSRRPLKQQPVSGQYEFSHSHFHVLDTWLAIIILFHLLSWSICCPSPPFLRELYVRERESV